MTIKFGIIGTGEIVKNRFMPAISLIDEVQVTALMDVDEKRAKALATEYGISKTYTDPQHICEDKNIDAVYIASPPNAHFSQVRQAAENGKAILCEKPMAPTLLETRAIVDVCEKEDVLLMIALTSRFAQSHIKVKELIQAGYIGEPVLVKIEYFYSITTIDGPSFTINQFRLQKNRGGGALLDIGVHAFDLIHYLLDGEIVEVCAYSSPLTLPVDVDDTSVVIARLASGSIANISIGINLVEGKNGIDLYSPYGAIITEKSFSQEPTGHVKSFVAGKWMEHPIEPIDAYRTEILHFLDAMRDRNVLGPSGNVGEKAMRVCFAAMKSNETGQCVATSDL